MLILPYSICKQIFISVDKILDRDYIGQLSHPEFYYPLLAKNPTPIPNGKAAFNLELLDFVYTTDKTLDIRFPAKMVLKGLRIETLKEKYLKSFYVEYTKLDYVSPDQLATVELQPSQPIVSHENQFIVSFLNLYFCFKSRNSLYLNKIQSMCQMSFQSEF